MTWISWSTKFVGMKNVTVTMEDDVARWARIAAAERHTSVSRFVGEVLRERMAHDVAYDEAMREFLSTVPTGASGGMGLPRREEVHDRPLLRR